ncbi:MAG: hypothetical protein RR485_03885 [Mucinivorans sp.]
MKHVFVVHSNITYLSALGVMAAEGLSVDDCILVSEGVFMRSDPVPMVAIPYMRGLKACGFNLLIYLTPYKYVDQKIAELTAGEPFTAYVATLGKLARYTITHPLCAQFHFVEEGLLSYVTLIKLDILTLHNSDSQFRPRGLISRLKDIKWALVRAYSPRISALPLFYNAYAAPDRRFYGYTAQSHTLIDPACRRLISMEQITARFHFDHTLDLDNSVIWIGDCVDGIGHTAAQYISAIERGLVDQVLSAEKISHIFVKFHYREDAASRAATLDVFARHAIAVTIVADSAIMEIELLGTTSVRLYGTYSSLLVYGVFAGCRAFSVDRFYEPARTDTRLDCIFDFIERL